MAFLNKTELLASYADNSTQNIKAVTHRDYVDSVMVYGAMKSGGYETQVTTTPQKIEFDQFMFGYGMAGAADGNTSPTVGALPNGGTYNEFNNVEEGHYLNSMYIYAELSDNDYLFQLYDGETPIGTGVQWPAKDAGDFVNLAFPVPELLPVNVARVSLRVSANKNSNTTFGGISWVMHRMGSA